MDGIIHIKEHPIDCSIGVHPFEKRSKQIVLIDVELTISFSPCIESDHLDDTIDYDKVIALATHLGEVEHTHLLETFTHKLLMKIFAEFPTVKKGRVKVTKPMGLPKAQGVSCTMEHSR